MVQSMLDKKGFTQRYYSIDPLIKSSNYISINSVSYIQHTKKHYKIILKGFCGKGKVYSNFELPFWGSNKDYCIVLYCIVYVLLSFLKNMVYNSFHNSFGSNVVMQQISYLPKFQSEKSDGFPAISQKRNHVLKCSKDWLVLLYPLPIFT